MHPKAQANSTKPIAQSQNYHSSTLRSRSCYVILICAVVHSQSCDSPRRKLAKQPRSSATYYVVTQALTQAVHSEMVHETEDATAHARPLSTYVVAAFEQL